LSYIEKLRLNAQKSEKYKSICENCKFGYKRRYNEKSYFAYGRHYFEAYYSYSCLLDKKAYKVGIKSCLFFERRGNNGNNS
jgi:hypothetical protein